MVFGSGVDTGVWALERILSDQCAGEPYVDAST